MSITDQACPGPCNARARAAYEAYDEAVTRHGYEMLLHADALDRHQQAIAAWHPPLDYPAEPIEPRRPEPPTMPVPVGQPVWCGRCARTLHSALAELDDTAALLDASINGHRGAAMAGPNGTKPVQHIAIVDTLDELVGWLFEVEDAWRAAREYPPRPRRARGAHARAVSVGWLLGQWGDLLLDPWSVGVGLEVLRWQRRLRWLAKADPTSRRSPIACPRCREQQVQRGDDGYWQCRSCGRLMNEAEYGDEYARQAEEHEQQEVTA